MKKTSQEILQDLKNKTIMTCRRNNGMIAPTSIRLMSFEEAVSQIYVSSYEYSGKTFYSFWGMGVYLFEDEKPRNIHHLLRKLLREGALTLQVDENDRYKRPRIAIVKDS